MWNLGWRRRLFDWEKNQVSQLLEMVHDSFLDLEKVDKWVWKADMCLKFLVKSTYDILKGEFEGDHPQLFNSFWRIKALPLAHFVA